MNCWRMTALMPSRPNSPESSTLSATSVPVKVSSALYTLPEAHLPRHSMSANFPIRCASSRTVISPVLFTPSTLPI